MTESVNAASSATGWGVKASLIIEKPTLAYCRTAYSGMVRETEVPKMPSERPGRPTAFVFDLAERAANAGH